MEFVVAAGTVPRAIGEGLEVEEGRAGSVTRKCDVLPKADRGGVRISREKQIWCGFRH